MTDYLDLNDHLDTRRANLRAAITTLRNEEASLRFDQRRLALDARATSNNFGAILLSYAHLSPEDLANKKTARALRRSAYATPGLDDARPGQDTRSIILDLDRDITSENAITLCRHLRRCPDITLYCGWLDMAMNDRCALTYRTNNEGQMTYLIGAAHHATPERAADWLLRNLS